MALSKVEEELERIHSRNEDLLDKIKQVDQAQDKRIGELERRIRELELRATALTLGLPAHLSPAVIHNEKYAKHIKKKRN